MSWYAFKIKIILAFAFAKYRGKNEIFQILNYYSHEWSEGVRTETKFLEQKNIIEIENIKIIITN